MTGRELVKYIEKWGLEDYRIEVQYRDDGGCYYGTDDYVEPLIVEVNTPTKYAGCVEYGRVIL